MKEVGRVFTSESVTEGHPDKICDQISDTILDRCLEQDKDSRVACECFAGKGFLLIGGEMTTKANLNIDNIAREVIRDIGYTSPELGFDADTVAISCMMNKQSADIAQGVDTGGAGDQGIMFGYACNETKEFMPAPIQFAHALTKSLAEARKTTLEESFRPDGKSQVSVRYDENGKIIGVDTILISTQHCERASQKDVKELIDEYIIKAVIDNGDIPEELITADTKILINPTGRFVVGGPMGDTGLTGRKIIVDTYGGYSRHGGGCFSGKDPTKVDRSAAYMARYLAKNVVASGITDRCEVQLAYAIGVAKPVSIYVDANCNINLSRKIEDTITNNFDLTPNGIINFLDLKNVKYRPLASYGHFGRSCTLAPWEQLNYVELFKELKDN